MSKERSVVFIKGLNDNSKLQHNLLVRATNHWRSCDLNPVIYTVGWEDGEHFNTKLRKAIEFIDDLYEKEGKLPIIGLSAGGSMAINLNDMRSYEISSIGIICARLRVGPTTGYRSFYGKTQISKAFADSVKSSEKILDKMKNKDKKKIITVRSSIWDESVPLETIMIEGAKNIAIPIFEHVLTIGAALTIFSGPIIEFVKRKD